MSTPDKWPPLTPKERAVDEGDTTDVYTWTPKIRPGPLTFSKTGSNNISLTDMGDGLRASIDLSSALDPEESQSIVMKATTPGGSFITEELTLTGVAGAATAPDAPTIASLTPGDESLSMAFTDGSANGSAITGHKLYLGASALTLAYVGPFADASPYVIDELVNGEEVFVGIKAVNAIGDSPMSNIESETPSASGSINTPLGLVDAVAGTFTLTNPQVGVSYALNAIDHTGSSSSVGALDSGNSYSRSISSTTAKKLRVTATLDADTAYSDDYILDQQNIVTRTNFADVADNADLSAMSGWARTTGSAGDFKVDDGVLQQTTKPGTASVYTLTTTETILEFNCRVGIPANNFSAWRILRLNRGGTHYLDATISAAQYDFAVRQTSNDATISSANGYWIDSEVDRNLEDGDLLSFKPVFNSAGTTLYYQMFIGTTPILTDNSGKGIQATLASMNGTNFVIGGHGLNASASDPALPWDIYHYIELRGHDATKFFLAEAVIDAPTMSNPPQVTFSAFYIGTRTSFVAALFNKSTGQMLTDFETFSTAGSGLTGDHVLEFDAVDGGGADVGIICFDPSDAAATFSVLSCGYLPYYPEMPTVQYLGPNIEAAGSHDFFQNRWLYGYHTWSYMNNVGGVLDSTAYPLDKSATGEWVAGTISSAAASAGAVQFVTYIHRDMPVAHGQGGSWKTVTNLNPTYWTVTVATTGFGVSGASVNGANNDITYTMTAGMKAELKVVITPQSGYLAHLPPDGFQFVSAPVSADMTKLLNPQFVTDYGAGASRGPLRTMQMDGSADLNQAETSIVAYPFMDRPWPVRYPDRLSRMAAEAGTFTWSTITVPPSNALLVEWAIETARQIKAYDDDAGIDDSLKWPGVFAWEIGNEVWNTAPPYGEKFKKIIPLAGEAGFISGVTSLVILDHINQDYVEWQGGGDYHVTHAVWPANGSIFCYRPGGEWVIITNTTGSTLPIGTALPQTYTIGYTLGSLRIDSNFSTIFTFCRDWMAWALGVIGDGMRYGTVPASRGAIPDLSSLEDETVALGYDRIKMVFATWQAHSAQSIADQLLAGGTGTENVLKIDAIGPSWYANIDLSVSNPATEDWEIAIEAATNETEYADDAWPVFKDYLDTLVYGNNGTLDAIRNQYHGVVSLLRQADIPANKIPKLWLYEGGPHISVQCAGGNTQAVKYDDFIVWLDYHPPFRQWNEDFLEAVRQIGPEVICSYTSYEFPVSITGTAAAGTQNFGILSYVGSQNAKYEARYQGETDFIANAPTIG